MSSVSPCKGRKVVILLYHLCVIYSVYHLVVILGPRMDSAASVVSPSPSCSVCHRAISVTAAGLVCLHGPVHSRCPGSPALQIQSTPSHPPGDSGDNCRLSPSQCHSPSPVLPPRSTAAILKRIPRVYREASAKKLASILEDTSRIQRGFSKEASLNS